MHGWNRAFTGANARILSHLGNENHCIGDMGHFWPRGVQDNLKRFDESHGIRLDGFRQQIRGIRKSYIWKAFNLK